MPEAYHTVWEAGGFVSTVDSSVPMRYHPTCLGLLRCIGRAAGSTSEAEEDAAAVLIRALGWRRGFVVDDANWTRVLQMRREASQLRTTVNVACAEKKQAATQQEEAVEKALLLELGL
jgi:hypothetical protein